MEKRKFDLEFRRNAVNLLLTSGKTQRQLCSDLGVTYGLIGKWRRQFDLERPENATMKAATDNRIRELERELAIVKQERDILKKSMGIVSRL